MAKNTTYDKALMTTEEEEFARLFGENVGPTAGPWLQRGDMAKGRIVRMGPENTFINLGGKAEGVIDTRELEALGLKVGDMLEAMVISTTGEVRLSRTLAASSHDQQAIADAHEMGMPIEGRIEGRNKGGFDVKIGSQTAFLPVSHLDIRSVEDLDAWIGQTHRFKIIERDPAGRRLVVSRAQLLRDEREAQAEKLWDQLAVGQTLQGTVTSIHDYGCFVDVGGADGLVHIREMRWGRVEHPSELVTVGQEITVTVQELDRTKKRIGLSMKSADGDPWRRMGTDITVGDTLEGTVTRTEKYGAFVELLPGLEGLVHVSEMTWLRHVRHASEVVAEGQRLKVVVLDIDHVGKRVSLSMRQLEADPWSGATERYAVGSSVTGTVARTAQFGIFVDLEPGLTALLPASETNLPRGTDLSRQFRPGQTVTASVISVDELDKRMSLSLRAAEEAEAQRNVTEYQRSRPAADRSFGTFADLLKHVKLDG